MKAEEFCHITLTPHLQPPSIVVSRLRFVCVRLRACAV